MIASVTFFLGSCVFSFARVTSRVPLRVQTYRYKKNEETFGFSVNR